MSKNTPVSFKNKVPEKAKMALPAEQKINLMPPTIRDVSAPAVLEENNVIAVYKDLNQPEIDAKRRQNQQLFFAFGFFIILGLGILMGTHFTKKRGVASDTFKGFIAEGEDVKEEHYHFDKSCYTGENGEQVCMTRTSKK